MLRNISQIVYQLFQKETLDEVSESELRYFTRQYPFAGTGHLLLAKKLQLQGEKRAFEREIAVTSIYFNNPAWLQFVLQEPNGNGTEESRQHALPVLQSETQTESDHEISEGHSREISEEHSAVDDEIIEHSAEPAVVKAGAVDNSVKYNDVITGEARVQPGEYNVDEQPGEPDIDLRQTGENEYNADAHTENQYNADEHTEKIYNADEQLTSVDETTSGEGATNSDVQQPLHDEALITESPDQYKNEAQSPGLEEIPTADSQLHEIDSAVEPQSQSSHTNTISDDDGSLFAGFIKEETNEEIRLNEETLNAPWEMEEEGENTGEADSPGDERVSDEDLRDNFEKRKHLTSGVVAGDAERHESFHSSPDGKEDLPNRESELSDDAMVDRPDLISFEAQKASQRDPLPLEGEQMRAPKSDEAADDRKLAFDPYHTIDYFASQGIKLKLEDLSKDKLGQQLKSFTEWIRSMKRLPQQVAENGLNETDQSSIRRIAEHSVEEKEVLTESMAEVWVKQGNYEKARQIYRKLSLQNPSKSTYFAAKIDQLKVL
ncbi:hypothetical protein [Flavitalea antarctica]